MHPFLNLPAPLLGALLLLVGLGWCWHWRRKPEDDEDRDAWKFGLVLAACGLILLPGLITLPPLPTYGVMMASGCLAVTVLGIRWATQRGLLKMEHMLELLLFGGLCGLIGARAVFLVEQHDLFQDQPPVLRCPGILQPLAKGDTLVLRPHGGQPVTITFSGTERDQDALQATIAKDAGPAGVTVDPIYIRRRGDDGVAATQRGLLIATERTGSNTSLEVIGGAAAKKLGLDPVIGRRRGLDIPFTRIFDLTMGGLTYFGSVFGVLTFSFFYLRFRKVSMLAMLDVMAPTLPLGLFFGRMGCYSRGCCFGRQTGDGSLFPGVQYETWSLPWQQFAREKLNCGYDILLSNQGKLSEDVAHYLGPYGSVDQLKAVLGALADKTPPLHATQLYEGFSVLLIVFLVLAYRRWIATRIGETFAVLVLLQAPVRFVVEHFRRDHEVFFKLGGYPFTESQLVALAMALGGAAALALLRRKGRPVESPQESAPEESAPEEPAPEESAPEEPAPEASAPEASAPEASAPEESAE